LDFEKKKKYKWRGVGEREKEEGRFSSPFKTLGRERKEKEIMATVLQHSPTA